MGIQIDIRRPWVRRARLQTELSDKRVRCGTCAHGCIIGEGEFGRCRTRANIDGFLYTLVYGHISSLSANPAEKKPFFHFWPGHRFLTAGTYGCTFTCPWCQNWPISKTPPDPEKANYVGAEDFVELILREGCVGSCFSFNEPTLFFEYALDVFQLAKQKGFVNTFVTNGYMSSKTLQMLHEAGLDAISVDVKGDIAAVRKYCGGDVEVVWRNVREAKRLGIHVEVVNLLIPGVNDREDQIRYLVRRHLREAGRETPLHFTRYYPAYEFDAPPTPIPTLEFAHGIAKSEGIEFVYLGNVPGHPYENTYCPKCGTLLIERYGLELVRVRLREKRCVKCGERIPIRGRILGTL